VKGISPARKPWKNLFEAEGRRKFLRSYFFSPPLQQAAERMPWTGPYGAEHASIQGFLLYFEGEESWR
jgi:hypothetical protein